MTNIPWPWIWEMSKPLLQSDDNRSILEIKHVTRKWN
uniref:Uncharacterized protein n=1 Tax=Anguilla anguilla TaxID=7936 RepID=A0A0E9UED3_ANGAN